MEARQTGDCHVAFACSGVSAGGRTSSGSRSQALKNAALTMLLFVPGVIHALGVVERRTVERQYASVFAAMDRMAA